MNQSRNGVPEFDFCIADAVPAYNDAVGLLHFRQPAAHYLFEYVQVAVLRKAHNRESGEGTAAHRIDIAKGVGRRNLAEGERVIYERSEEIDGLDNCEVRRNPIDTRIIRSIETAQQVSIVLPRQPRQHFGQRTGRQLARASTCLYLLRQSYGCSIRHPVFLFHAQVRSYLLSRGAVSLRGSLY